MSDGSPNIDRKGTLFGVLTKAMKAKQQQKAGGDAAAKPSVLEAATKALAANKAASPFSKSPRASTAGEKEEDPFGPLMPTSSKKDDQQESDERMDRSPHSDAGLSPGSKDLSRRGSGSSRGSMGDGGGEAEDITSQLSSRPLPMQYVISNLNQRIEVRHLYTDLALFFPFLILFFVFYLFGREIEINHFTTRSTRAAYLTHIFPSVERNVETCKALRDEQGSECILPEDRMFKTVRGTQDFLMWLDDVLIPNTWECDHPEQSHNPLIARGQQTNLGAMQIRIINAKNDSCTFNPNMLETVKKLGKEECFTSYGFGTTETGGLCGLNNPALATETLFEYKNSIGSLTTGTYGVYASGGYGMTLPFNATCSQIRKAITAFRQPGCRVLDDRRTRLVVVEWFVYNPNTDTFSTVKLFFEGTMGGSWIPNYQFRPFPVWSSTRISETALTFFFLLFITYYWYRFFYEAVLHYRHFNELASYIFNVWNVLELVNLTTFFTVIVLRLMWWTQSMQQSSTQPFKQVYPQTLDSVALLFSAQIYANSVNAVITVLKTLKFVRLNNRLNVLTRTLDASKESIAGVLLLFIFVLLGYAVCATALYGGNMVSFRSLDTSFSSLLLFIFGIFDYDKMRSIQPLLTGVFFFTYTILANFILLNFIIAILGEGFTTVSKSSSLEPLDQIFLRWLNMLRFRFHPKYLRKMLELSLRGKTFSDLLFEMTKYLTEHMDLIELTSPELLDSDLPITKQDLKNWLPEHLDEDLGDFYVAVLWDDLDHEHSIDALSQEYLAKKEIEELVSTGVGQTIAVSLSGFDGLTDVIERLESRVALIEDAVKN